MPFLVDGATIEVAADLGPARDPFILDRDQVDTAGSILTPVADALAELTAEVIAVDATWGASDLMGPLTVVDAGTLTVEVNDPDRDYDPGNPALADPPSIGRAIAIRIDGALVWSGRIVRAAHDWAQLLTTLEAEDTIAEASRQGVSVDLAQGEVRVQLQQLVAAAGWPSARFIIHGALSRSRGPERFTGSLLEGLQRLQLAELGALFADQQGRLVFRGRSQGPVVTTSRMTVGLEPGTPVTTIETSNDARIVNAVYVEPLAAGPVDRFADARSVSAHGEVALEVAASDLLLVPSPGVPVLQPVTAPAVGVPVLVSPSGPRSPWDPFLFTFPTGAPAPDRYDIQAGTDPAFGTIDLWHYTQQTAGLTGWAVAAPYLGAAPAIGVTYYWRARGRLGASEIGPWSRVVRWLPDPAGVSVPYADWARDVLGAWSEPRPVVVLGTLLPVSAEVLALLGTEYAGRWLVRDDRHPPPTSQLVAVYGITFHVDMSTGWEVAGLTSNVPPGDV